VSYTNRSQLAVTAALLHDVVDDTRVDIAEVEAAFGAQTSALVATVTRLSQMNQLMRRKARKAREQVGFQIALARALAGRHGARGYLVLHCSGHMAAFGQVMPRLGPWSAVVWPGLSLPMRCQIGM
jgi:HD domain